MLDDICGCNHEHSQSDHFKAIGPETNWMSAIEHAKKLGLGNDEYELIEIK